MDYIIAYMKTTVGGFAELVGRDYDPNVQEEFVSRFLGAASQEIDFGVAMRTLSTVLNPSGVVRFPSSGPTGPMPPPGRLVFAD